MANLNPLHPPANSAGNKKAPAPNPNPVPAAVPRAADNQNQPVDPMNAPITKRKTRQSNPKSKRQKTDAASPTDKAKSSRKAAPSKESASKRQKTAAGTEDIKTMLDLRQRILKLKQKEKLTPKTISTIKPDQYPEARLRNFIKEIITIAPKINKKTNLITPAQYKDSQVLSDLAFQILKNPKDPDYLKAFLYLISRHPQHVEQAHLVVTEFLALSDETLKVYQEQLRFKLMSVSKGAKLYPTGHPRLYPSLTSTYTEDTIIPSLLRILEKDEFDHPIYDKLLKYAFAYWQSRLQIDFKRINQEAGDNVNQNTRFFIDKLDESKWIFPLDLLKKMEKMIAELATNMGAQKHSLALEIILRYHANNRMQNLDLTILQEKFFIVSPEFLSVAHAHALHFAETDENGFKLLYHLYNTTLFFKLNQPGYSSFRTFIIQYLEKLTIKILNDKDNILSQGQFDINKGSFRDYERAMKFLLSEMSSNNQTTLFQNLIINTQIDKNDLLSSFLIERAYLLFPWQLAPELLKCIWDRVLSQWVLADFEQFYVQIQEVLFHKKRFQKKAFHALQNIIYYTIALCGSPEICRAYKETILNYLFSIKSNQNEEIERHISAIYIRLYNINIIREDLQPGNDKGNLIRQQIKNFSQAIYRIMPAIFKDASEPQPNLSVAAAQQERVAPRHPPAPAAALAQPNAAVQRAAPVLVAPMNLMPPSLTHEENALKRVDESLKSLKQSFVQLYGTKDQTKWDPKTLHDFKALIQDITVQKEKIMPIQNPHCKILHEILNNPEPDLKEKLLEAITKMRDGRSNHDLYGKEQPEIIKTLDHIIATVDDETVRLRAQLIRLDFQDPLDTSGAKIALLRSHIQLFIDNWEDNASSQEKALEACRAFAPYFIDYLSLVANGSEPDLHILGFLEEKIQPMLTESQDSSLALLRSYNQLIAAQRAEPNKVAQLFITIADELKKPHRGSFFYVNIITYATLFTKQHLSLQERFETTLQTYREFMFKCWASIPWSIQTNSLFSPIFDLQIDWRGNADYKSFFQRLGLVSIFKLYNSYLLKKTIPQSFIRLATSLIFRKNPVKDHETRLFSALTELYDQFPLPYKRQHTQVNFRQASPEIQEKMIQFMLDEFKKPESAAMIRGVLSVIDPVSYHAILHRFLDLLIKDDLKDNLVRLSVLREAAKVTIPAVPFAAHEIPQHFEALFNNLNMTDESESEFISISTILGMNETEFNRSIYKGITRDQMRIRCIRFLKDLINRNLPADRQLVLSPEEVSYKSWLPDPSLDAEWMQMISIMITKIKETEDRHQRDYNIAILINGLFVCPTGQASAIETAYTSIVLKKELGSRSFKEVILYLIQESQETSLLKALSMPNSIVGGAQGRNVHNEQIYRLILKPTFGLRQLTSYKESIARITTWADIEKVLSFFRQQWTEDMIIEPILKSFGTKEDCEIAYTLGTTNQAEALKANKQAQRERPLRILDSQGASYLDWIMQNNLDPEEYGITIAKDETGQIDLYNFKIEKIEITKEIVVKVLTHLGYWVAG